MTEPEILHHEPVPTAVIRGMVPVAELPGFFDRSFPVLFAAVAEQGASPAGAALALHHRPPDGTADLEIGFPTDRPVSPAGDVVPGTLPAGRVARVVHAGGYDGLGAAWERLGGWMRQRGLRPGPVLWEVYLTQPRPDMDPADLRTELNWSIADS